MGKKKWLLEEQGLNFYFECYAQYVMWWLKKKCVLEILL